MNNGQRSDCGMNRRDFIKFGGVVVGALATVRMPVAFGAEPVRVAVGKEADFPKDQPVSVAEGKAFVVRRDSGLQARSSRCTHAGCEVSWKSDAFVCPCHKARYGLDGEVLRGPAREPLAALPVKIEGGLVLLQI